MEILAMCIICVILFVVIVINTQLVFDVMCYFCIMTYILMGFGAATMFISASDLLFADTPFLSGLIGWLIHTVLFLISLYFMSNTNNKNK